MTNNLPESVKDVMRTMAYELAELLILEDFPFRLIIWNNDNWNKPLPDNIMEKFPAQIVIDIKELALKDSFIDENTGELIINTYFNDAPYSKVLDFEEIVAILDLDGQPLIVNNFEPETPFNKPVLNRKKLQNKKDLVDLIVSEGIDEEDAYRSVNAFIKNNPNLTKDV
jgi:hypothetical protein